MRTAISAAAPPRRLRWQAAFVIKAYRTLSRVVWHRAFVCDTRGVALAARFAKSKC